jgi:hypothetical protein
MFSAMCTLLNQYGKDNFKPIMKESFNNITHTNNSVTEKLFGDDLQKKIEDISKLRKIIISNFDDKLSGSCVTLFSSVGTVVLITKLYFNLESAKNHL